MQTFQAVVVAVLACNLILGAEPTPQEKLDQAALKYIELQSSKEAEAKWARSFQERVEQRMKDNESLSMETAARNMALDWAADQRKKIKDLSNAEPAVVLEACRIFTWFRRNKIKLPSQIEDATETQLEAAAKHISELAEKSSVHNSQK